MKNFLLILVLSALTYGFPYIYRNSHKIEASVRCYFDIPKHNTMRDFSCYPLTKEEKTAWIERETVIFETASKLNSLTQNN